MKLSVVIASVPDRDDLVAEIWGDDLMIGEVRKNETGELTLDIYSRPGLSHWSVSLTAYLEILERARSGLTST
jgi:hypothetical protein